MSGGRYFIDVQMLKNELDIRGWKFGDLAQMFCLADRSAITHRNQRGWEMSAYFDLLTVLGFDANTAIKKLNTRYMATND